MQQEIHEVLMHNMGNRLTQELINGITARLDLIGRQAVERAVAAVRAEHSSERSVEVGNA